MFQLFRLSHFGVSEHVFVIGRQVAYILEGKDALRLQILLLNTERQTDKENDFDLYVKVQMNCLQCIFINEFVVRVLVMFHLKSYV